MLAAGSSGDCPRRAQRSPPRTLGRLVGRGLFDVGHQVATVLARVVGEASRRTRRASKRSSCRRATGSNDVSSRAAVQRSMKSSRQNAASERAAAQPGSRARSPFARRRSRRPTRLGRRRCTAAVCVPRRVGRAACRPRASGVSPSPPTRRSMMAAQEHRGPEDPAGLAPVRRDELGDVAAAEPVLPLEVRPKAEVENALVDDRIHHRLLRARPDRRRTDSRPRASHREGARRRCRVASGSGAAPVLMVARRARIASLIARDRSADRTSSADFDDLEAGLLRGGGGRSSRGRADRADRAGRVRRR